MDQHILTFAFPFPYGSPGANLVLLAQEVCQSNGLTGQPAGMGPHATIVPPFYCSTKEKKALAILARHMWEFNGQEVHVKATNFGIFDPPNQDSDTGALYIAVEVDETYRKFVERHKLEWPFEFVQPRAKASAVDRVWVPHISVIEAPNLHRTAILALPRLNEYVRDKMIPFGEPLFFEKIITPSSKEWVPVLV